jgi:hypothetical protein
MVMEEYMKYQTLLIICIALWSCSKNSQNNNLNLTQNIFETEENNFENNGIIIPNNYIGVYLPKEYTDALIKIKSHAVASYELNKNVNKQYNAIVIYQDKITYIYNFHEAVNRKISNIIDDKIILESVYGSNQYIYLKNNQIVDENDMTFFCINNDPENFRNNISGYITEKIFKEEHYFNKDGEELYRLENGKISHNNIIYEINLDTVFSNDEYDYLKANDHSNIHFKIIDGICKIYDQEIPEEYIGDPIQNKYAKYTVIDEYK